MAPAPIGSVAPTVPQPSPPSTSAGGKTLDKDVFLQLLVAQLKYQDPSNPTDSAQFLAQTAQFTLVEKMEELANSQAELLDSSRLSSATSLVGSKVTYLQAGVSGSGTVTGVSISGGVPTLLLGDTKVQLSEIQKVETAR